jgi:ribosome biogenesis protein BRX1
MAPVDPIADVSYRRHQSAVGPKYKHQTLVFATRGIVARERYFLNDLRNMIPHHKPESKLDVRQNFSLAVFELCSTHKCDSTILLENRKRKDLYLWIALLPAGPSVRFLVQNLHTMAELKMTGNCIKGSRPVLHFDKAFELSSHMRLLKAMLTRTFGTPRFHAKSRPFVDHIVCFFFADNKIYFRHYQIVEEEVSSHEIERSLLEIGPRFVMTPIHIFHGLMHGKSMWKNTLYKSPTKMRTLEVERRRAGGVKPRYSKDVRGIVKRSKRDRKHYLQKITPKVHNPTENAFKRGAFRQTM